MNDLKSIGFLDNLSYESNKRTRKWWTIDHIAVYSNYARDLVYDIIKYGYNYLIFFHLKLKSHQSKEIQNIIDSFDIKFPLANIHGDWI